MIRIFIYKHPHAGVGEKKSGVVLNFVDQEFDFFLCFLLSGLVIIYVDKITIFVTTFLNTFLF